MNDWSSTQFCHELWLIPNKHKSRLSSTPDEIKIYSQSATCVSRSPLATAAVSAYRPRLNYLTGLYWSRVESSIFPLQRFLVDHTWDGWQLVALQFTARLLHHWPSFKQEDVWSADSAPIAEIICNLAIFKYDLVLSAILDHLISTACWYNAKSRSWWVHV